MRKVPVPLRIKHLVHIFLYLFQYLFFLKILKDYYDLSLLHSAGNLTGTILDHNKEIFGKQTPWQESSENGQTSSLEDKPAPDIRIIRTASEIVQAKLLPQLIEELYPEGYSDKEGIETAIILPDTGMLMPVLNSLAETVGRINVTMGYPLSQSAISIFVEKWISSLFQRSYGT